MSYHSGIGGIYGNKGAIVARMVINDTSICFINVHLAAGQTAKLSRNTDLGAILEEKAILPASGALPYVHGGDGTLILDHEMVILNGDLNVNFHISIGATELISASIGLIKGARAYSRPSPLKIYLIAFEALLNRISPSDPHTSIIRDQPNTIRPKSDAFQLGKLKLPVNLGLLPT